MVRKGVGKREDKPEKRNNANMLANDTPLTYKTKTLLAFSYTENFRIYKGYVTVWQRKIIYMPEKIETQACYRN